jgi:hypothetical protein
VKCRERGDLVRGAYSVGSANSSFRRLELVREASTASIDLIGGCSESFSSEKFGKLVAYVFRQSLITGVRPCEIVDSSLNSIIR